MAILNPSDLIDSTNSIPDQQIAPVMLSSIENKNLLQNKGSIYVGTGARNQFTDFASNQYNIAKTGVLESNNVLEGSSLIKNSSTETGLEWSILPSLSQKVFKVVSSGSSNRLDLPINVTLEQLKDITLNIQWDVIPTINPPSFSIYIPSGLLRSFSLFFPHYSENTLGVISKTYTPTFPSNLGQIGMIYHVIFDSTLSGPNGLGGTISGGFKVLNNPSLPFSTNYNTSNSERILTPQAIRNGVSSALNSYLPLSGGTLTGDLNLRRSSLILETAGSEIRSPLIYENGNRVYSVGNPAPLQEDIFDVNISLNGTYIIPNYRDYKFFTIEGDLGATFGVNSIPSIFTTILSGVNIGVSNGLRAETRTRRSAGAKGNG